MSGSAATTATGPAAAARPSELLAVRQRRALLLSAAAIVVLAWAVLIASASVPTSAGGLLPEAVAAAAGIVGPHAAPAGLAGLGVAALMWLVMSVAMMLPAVMPWIMVLATVAPGAWPRRKPQAAAAQFVAGYFVIWAGYSLAAAALQLGLQHLALVDSDLRATAALGGAILVGAGAFQFTGLKESCLAHCRSPLSFFLTRWEDGPGAPMRMGLGHGLYCLGCCWALMAVSFAVGVMNLAWMAVVTLIVCIEKMAPGGDRLGRWLGVGLATWGGWLIVSG